MSIQHKLQQECLNNADLALQTLGGFNQYTQIPATIELGT